MLGEAVVAFPKFRASGGAKIWRQGSAIDKARAKWAGGAERVKGTRDVSDDDVRALDQGREKPWPRCVQSLGSTYINTAVSPLGSCYSLSTNASP